MTYEVSPYTLKITYPNGAANSTFVFFASPSLSQLNVGSLSDIQGANISVSGNVNMTANIAFGGLNGGAYSAYYDYEYWRIEYNMTAGFTGTPELTLKFN